MSDNFTHQGRMPILNGLSRLIIWPCVIVNQFGCIVPRRALLSYFTDSFCIMPDSSTLQGASGNNQQVNPLSTSAIPVTNKIV
jgi:hypothetical protein